MECQTYVNLLSSGQLEEVDAQTRKEASVHVSGCVHCQAFTHNQQVLTAVFARYRADSTLKGAEPQNHFKWVD